jgi:hypothetical protein
VVNYDRYLPLIAKRDRRSRHQGYHMRPKYRTRTYRRCTYKVSYRRGIRHRYRVCNYYRR